MSRRIGTRDGWLWAERQFPHQFEALCRVVCAEDLLADNRFATPRARSEHSLELKSELARRWLIVRRKSSNRA